MGHVETKKRLDQIYHRSDPPDAFSHNVAMMNEHRLDDGGSQRHRFRCPTWGFSFVSPSKKMSYTGRVFSTLAQMVVRKKMM